MGPILPQTAGRTVPKVDGQTGPWRSGLSVRTYLGRPEALFSVIIGPMPVTVAIAQARPHYLDLPRSLDRCLTLLEEAAARGAARVAFGETWLTGYPAWLDHAPGAALWDSAPVKDLHARLRAHSVTVPGPVTQRIGEAAARLRVAVAIGINERVDRGPGRGTLYNAFLLFDERGQLVIHHRKLVPTHGERLVWGPGDGAGLHAAETQAGRVGGLICWEHWMPLARQALHDDGEDLHVALWPALNDAHLLASRHYAFEGRCFVLCAGLLMERSDMPAEISLIPPAGGESERLLVRGGSAIVGPDGRFVVEPVFDREALIVAELDLTALDRERMTLDVTGHYHRPDVLRLEVFRGGRR